nr:ribonuclease H-like domain-containing protein [Tanacetum cinerariifolium]
SQIKFEDINQIDEDDMEEMDIKWNMALLSMRADKFWKRTRKKISIQGSDVAGFDKSKVECFNCHKMGYFARECRAPRNQERKGKKHRASCKTKPVSSVDQPLFRLHMDLLGPTFVKSLNKKSYCLVVIDNYSSFWSCCCWKDQRKTLKCVSAAGEELTAARHKLKLLV